MRSLQKSCRQLTAAALVFLLAGTAQAQISTATIRGQVTTGGSPAAVGLSVVAVNKDSGFNYRTVTLQDGSYVISGLPPGPYEIRVTGPNGVATSESVTLAVGDAASLDLAMNRPEGKAEEITVVGTRAQRKAVKTSQVGTNVAPVLIEGLPQTTHNFLSSADLAPGVVFEQDPATGNTSIKAGAQNHDNVNVFIDGVSQKNNVLRGGLTGQDSSRGNPFPQGAVKEFKIVSQNYKAEFDQVSSAAITAVTKSGGNDFHGEVYYDRTQVNWRAKSPLEITKEQAGQPLLPSNKNEFGLSLGGPIVPDAVNFFFAYDGKLIRDSRQVTPRNLDKFPNSTLGIIPQLAGDGGSYVDPFTEHLFFGKVNAELAPDRRLAVSSTLRLESDHIPEDLSLSAPGNDKNRTNDEFRVDATHEWNVNTDLLSETRLGYQTAYWEPQSNLNTPEIRYKVSTATPATVSSGGDIILTGGSPDSQVRGQRGVTLAQDLTWSALAGHVFKGGAKFSFLNYDLSGTSRAVDVVQTLIDPTTGNPYYSPASGGTCTGTNIINGGNNSDQCLIDRKLDSTSVSLNNGQIGVYAQDDWDLTSQLQLNIGLRWDVETNMLNNSYVTPADRIAALNGPDTRTFAGETATPGQTYAQSLAKGGVNINDYIADGNHRKPYLLAFAPRLGASYDVFGEKSTVVFAGYGRSYDRTMANHALDEKQKNLQTGGEIWLIREDIKMPYTDQFSVGVRQAVFMFNVEAVVSELDGKNQFQWFSGNRDLNGGYYKQSIVDPLFGGPAGYGSLILGDFIGETRTRQLLAKVEKPYSRASGWTATIAYTFNDAKTKHREWSDDIFDFTYGRAAAYRPFNTSRLVDKHRLVVAALADNLIPFGVVLASKFTYGSGLPRRVVGCPFVGNNPCDFLGNGIGAVAIEGNSPAFKQLDFSLSKRFGTGHGAVTVRADLLNAFNWNNSAVDTNPFGGVGVPPGKPANQVGLDNLTLDNQIGIRGPERTVKVGANYEF